MSDHYDPDIQAQKDYEALNAETARKLVRTAIKLKKAESRVAELEGVLRAARLADNATSWESHHRHMRRLRTAIYKYDALKGWNDECDHDPFTYTKHPAGDIATKCRKCGQALGGD